jgi:hypothetical protein
VPADARPPLACPACDYDLAGLDHTDGAGRTLLSCPECGRTFPEALLAQIYIERRATPSLKYLWAMLAAPIVIAPGLFAARVTGQPLLAVIPFAYPLVIGYRMARTALSRHGRGFGTGMALLLGPVIAIVAVTAESAIIAAAIAFLESLR